MTSSILKSRLKSILNGGCVYSGVTGFGRVSGACLCLTKYIGTQSGWFFFAIAMRLWI